MKNSTSKTYTPDEIKHFQRNSHSLEDDSHTGRQILCQLLFQIDGFKALIKTQANSLGDAKTEIRRLEKDLKEQIELCDKCGERTGQ